MTVLVMMIMEMIVKIMMMMMILMRVHLQRARGLPKNNMALTLF